MHEAAGGAGQEAGPVWRDKPESTVGGIRSREPGGSHLARWAGLSGPQEQGSK